MTAPRVPAAASLAEVLQIARHVEIDALGAGGYHVTLGHGAAARIGDGRTIGEALRAAAAKLADQVLARAADVEEELADLRARAAALRSATGDEIDDPRPNSPEDVGARGSPGGWTGGRPGG